MINLHERMLLTRQGSNLQPPGHQSNAHPAEPPRPESPQLSSYLKIIHHNIYFCIHSFSLSQTSSVLTARFNFTSHSQLLSSSRMVGECRSIFHQSISICDEDIRLKKIINNRLNSGKCSHNGVIFTHTHLKI